MSAYLIIALIALGLDLILGAVVALHKENAHVNRLTDSARREPGER